MKLLKDYLNIQKQLFEYFGYIEDWKVIPIDDCTDNHWLVSKDERSFWCHSPEPLTLESIKAGDSIYGGPIYTQRFLPKWVYRGEKFTMVCVDTQTDGNKFLAIYDNSKECKNPELIAEYERCWA